MDGQMVKDDFENFFLEEEGSDFEHIRNGSVVGIVRGILNGQSFQCKAESDIRIGDTLKSHLHGKSFLMKKIEFEVVGDVRTALTAHVSEV